MFEGDGDVLHKVLGDIRAKGVASPSRICVPGWTN